MILLLNFIFVARFLHISLNLWTNKRRFVSQIFRTYLCGFVAALHHDKCSFFIRSPKVVAISMGQIGILVRGGRNILGAQSRVDKCFTAE